MLFHWDDIDKISDIPRYKTPSHLGHSSIGAPVRSDTADGIFLYNTVFFPGRYYPFLTLFLSQELFF
jgi:hypothetical protein